MLVLERFKEETIIIGEDIIVKILDIYKSEKNNCLTVRLGITAPREIPVDREEIHFQKKGIKPKTEKDGNR